MLKEYSPLFHTLRAHTSMNSHFLSLYNEIELKLLHRSITAHLIKSSFVPGPEYNNKKD